MQRLFEKNYSEVNSSNILFSVVPLRAVIGLRFASPMELRAGLAAGGVLSQDLPWNSDVFRLGLEKDFLALSERAVTEVCRWRDVNGFSERTPGVLTGQGCRIHRKARLVGPIVLQPGCVVEEWATLIGPAVIGEGSRIMREAAVVQPALGRKSTVLPRAVLRHTGGLR